MGKEISSQEALSKEIQANYDVARIVLQELKRENRTLAAKDESSLGATSLSKKQPAKDAGNID